MKDSEIDDGETLVFTCAGAAHCGQVANRAAIELTRQGRGRIFCLAAVAASIPDKIERTRQAAVRIAIDGCEDACCRRVLEKAGLGPEVHVVVTDLGIEKQPEEPHMLMHSRRVVRAVQDALAARTGGDA